MIWFLGYEVMKLVAVIRYLAVLIFSSARAMAVFIHWIEADAESGSKPRRSRNAGEV